MIAAAPNLWWLMRVELFLATAILTLVLASGAIGRARSNAIPWLDLTLMTLTLMLGLHLSGWNAYGIGFLRSYAGDSLSMVFKTLLILCTIFSVWLAKKDDGWAGQRGAFFCALTLCGLLGMFFLVSSLDFLVFFLALELTGLSLYLLTAYSRKNPRSSEAGIKYLILGALSAALFVLGLALVIASTHSTSFLVTGQKLRLLQADPLLTAGLTLIVAALGFKLAAFPFQFWAPDVYEAAPTAVTAFLAMASKTAAAGAFCRFLSASSLLETQPSWRTPLMILSAASICYGNLCAIHQTRFKRLLAYASISSAGYLLMGLTAFDALSRQAVAYYLLSWLLACAGIFFILAYAARHAADPDNPTLEDLSGLAVREPLLGVAFAVSLISLAGVPPFAGFFGKFLILLGAFNQKLFWLATLGAVNILISMFYLLKIVGMLYQAAPPAEGSAAVPQKIPGRLLAQKVFALAVIASLLAAGIFQQPFLTGAAQAFSKVIS